MVHVGDETLYFGHSYAWTVGFLQTACLGLITGSFQGCFGRTIGFLKRNAFPEWSFGGSYHIYVYVGFPGKARPESKTQSTFHTGSICPRCIFLDPLIIRFLNGYESWGLSKYLQYVPRVAQNLIVEQSLAHCSKGKGNPHLWAPTPVTFTHQLQVTSRPSSPCPYLRDPSRDCLLRIRPK